jgi:hypothetical protein
LTGPHNDFFSFFRIYQFMQLPCTAQPDKPAGARRANQSSSILRHTYSSNSPSAAINHNGAGINRKIPAENLCFVHRPDSPAVFVIERQALTRHCRPRAVIIDKLKNSEMGRVVKILTVRKRPAIVFARAVSGFSLGRRMKIGVVGDEKQIRPPCVAGVRRDRLSAKKVDRNEFAHLRAHAALEFALNNFLVE